MYKSMLFLHIFFAMVWIGGMAFNLLFLHPSLKETREELKRELVGRVLRRFFLGVWLSIVVIFLTGMWMWHSVRVDFSQNFLFHIKLFIFSLMFINFAYIHFYLYRKRLYGHIPYLVWVNFLLGIVVTLIITYIR